MPRPLPRALRVPLRAASSSFALARYIAATLRPRTRDLGMVAATYAFHNDERDFARALLERYTHLWLFRSRQSMACGDFLVVDVSSPAIARRRVFALELKQGRPLSHGAGGAGWQLRNVRAAVAELVSAGIVDARSPCVMLAGDAARIAGALTRRQGPGGSELTEA